MHNCDVLNYDHFCKIIIIPLKNKKKNVAWTTNTFIQTRFKPENLIILFYFHSISPQLKILSFYFMYFRIIFGVGLFLPNHSAKVDLS